MQVHDILHFLPTSESSLMQFIFATEETGHRHLYLYSVRLAQPPSPNKITNTNGNLHLSNSCNKFGFFVEKL